LEGIPRRTRQTATRGLWSRGCQTRPWPWRASAARPGQSPPPRAARCRVCAHCGICQETLQTGHMVFDANRHWHFRMAGSPGALQCRDHVEEERLRAGRAAGSLSDRQALDRRRQRGDEVGYGPRPVNVHLREESFSSSTGPNIDLN
jgi:hypothetical protein